MNLHPNTPFVKRKTLNTKKISSQAQYLPKIMENNGNRLGYYAMQFIRYCVILPEDTLYPAE